MLDEMLPEVPWFNLGGWIVVTGTVLFLLLRGHLVPKRTVDWAEAINERTVVRLDKENEYLKSGLATSQETIQLLVNNQRELLQALDNTNGLIEGVHRALEKS